ncbi:tyrosine-type recombinase/integrase [Luteimonas saliphila]|uniref:tyrosine-type recombinase/integrase n=1 Tax=Luteimonas saliphila TaxID=2804919 RepID=UPI00192DD764|nr:integrase arm-type DNA-binding domain-containing protein [Luteimonas saliphila]
MLCTLQIKSAKPRARGYKLADAGGLFVLVQPSGSKLWRYKFRIGRVEGLLALGSFPEVGLAEARAEHARSRKLVEQGIHPVHERKRQREALAIDYLNRDKGAFGAIYAQWDSATSVDLAAGTIRQRRREIKNDLLPKLKDRAITSITRLELTAILKEVERRAPEIARNLRNYLWGIFECAIDSGLLENNPVPPLRVLKKRKQKNHAALSPSQIGEFLGAMDFGVNELSTRIAMRLVMLTACRKVEATGAEWTEFDLKRGGWEIPAERMKAGHPHWVPLPRQAVALLTELRAIVPKGQKYLFPNRRDPNRPMAGRTLNALMDRLGFGDKGTPHGMRAAFSTHFNGRHANADVIERCLAHVPVNAVRAAYNRHAYLKERRAMLQQWADYLDLLHKKHGKHAVLPPVPPTVRRKTNSGTQRRRSRRSLRKAA